MLSRQTPNFHILLSLLIVTAMGFFFKYYVGPGDGWLNNYGSAVFYEIFWCLFAFIFFKGQAAIWQIPLWVFLITCMLEFLQLWHPPLLEQFRATLIGQWLLGTTFTWWDFPHYLLGCVLGWLWLQKLPYKGSKVKGNV
ncbi:MULTISPECIES: ribosomal maturation YjgA family protein [Nostocales]|uniref:DUF2809 domain-containing protein n=2 Tax=Nostocales TaxID=1161 RepID=A0ABW8WSU9_9CYAN|nr:DUF2809 domain-containing protein [Tolypothrix bouteillei]